MYLIEYEMSRNDYYKAHQKLNDVFNESRYVATIFQSSINGFGYGIHDNGERQRQRQVMGDYEGLMFVSGAIQAEEEIIKNHPNASSDKAIYRDKEYDLHQIGIELTQEVLSNYCGQDFMMDDLVMTVFNVNQ